MKTPQFKCKRCGISEYDAKALGCPHGPCPMESAHADQPWTWRRIVVLAVMLLMIIPACIVVLISVLSDELDHRIDVWFDELREWAKK